MAVPSLTFLVFPNIYKKVHYPQEILDKVEECININPVDGEFRFKYENYDKAYLYTLYHYHHIPGYPEIFSHTSIGMNKYTTKAYRQIINGLDINIKNVDIKIILSGIALHANVAALSQIQPYVTSDILFNPILRYFAHTKNHRDSYEFLDTLYRLYPMNTGSISHDYIFMLLLHNGNEPGMQFYLNRYPSDYDLRIWYDAKTYGTQNFWGAMVVRRSDSLMKLNPDILTIKKAICSYSMNDLLPLINPNFWDKNDFYNAVFNNNFEAALKIIADGTEVKFNMQLFYIAMERNNWPMIDVMMNNIQCFTNWETMPIITNYPRWLAPGTWMHVIGKMTWIPYFIRVILVCWRRPSILPELFHCKFRFP